MKNENLNNLAMRRKYRTMMYIPQWLKLPGGISFLYLDSGMQNFF
jgi:hypothetical protein